MDKNTKILEALKMQPLSEEEMTTRHILGRLYGPIATCVAGGSVEDGKKDYIASSFETYESPLKSSADDCAGMVLLDALNKIAGDLVDFASWVYEGPDGYPLPRYSCVSALRK